MQKSKRKYFETHHKEFFRHGLNKSTLRIQNITLFTCFADIEDLTHKTGNFKQFSIFVSMLESAISQVRSASFT